MRVGDSGIMFIGSAVLSVVLVAVLARRGWLWGRREGPLVRDLAGPDALVWLIAGLLVWLGSMVGASAVAGFPDAWVGHVKSARRQALSQMAGYGLAITIGVLLLMMLRRWVADKAGAGLRLRWGDVPRGAAALALVAPFYVVVSQTSQLMSRWMTEATPSTIKHETLRKLSEGTMDGWSWVTIAGAVIGAPLLEELVYRVFIQGAALRATGGAWHGWAAVLITSAVWAPIHLIGGAVPLSAIPSLFVLGLGIGIAYERTRRLGVPIVMHVLFNAINVIAVTTGWVS